MTRRNLTPPVGIPIPGLPPTRRAGGARHNVSYRVLFFRGEAEITGWTLNVSRGGLRVVVEDRVELGDEFDILVADEATRRRGRVVWVQDEPDGAIVGISFLERLDHAPAGVAELDASIELDPREVAKALGVSDAELDRMLAPHEDEGGEGEK